VHKDFLWIKASSDRREKSGWHKMQLYRPNWSPLSTLVPLGGHSGINATYFRLKDCLTGKVWNKMWKILWDNVLSVSRLSIWLLYQLVYSNHCLFQKGHGRTCLWISIEGLPKSEGYNVILVIVDRFTKYAHFVPIKHPFTTRTIAKAVYDNVIKLHGLPKTIVSNRDKVFTSTVWKELFSTMGTQPIFSSAYHPQTDGQIERVNQCLEMYLRCAVHSDPKHWKS
jgi:hypothetical protein